MKRLIVGIALLIWSAGTAVEFAWAVDFISPVQTGQDFLVYIEGETASSCWYLDTVEKTQDGLVIEYHPTENYYNPDGGMCLGPSYMYNWLDTYVFTEPGEGLIRVTYSYTGTANPIPDDVYEYSFTVLAVVPHDGVSWGAIKALYR